MLRRTLREARKLLTPLPTVPEKGEMKFGPIKLSMFDPTPSDAVNEGPVFCQAWLVSEVNFRVP